ncbi:hypothetical protein BV898_01539 [Hypsibius exemplaris]|uniref:BZIP domain-containing protein n=1 Tax=Hypsibius exemplaris TaxID=2072580 RepID=A0A1W0XAD0_HYPEX|nr:hypothetical protein BV898_01539 [Hypsibius exemplaris]
MLCCVRALLSDLCEILATLELSPFITMDELQPPPLNNHNVLSINPPLPYLRPLFSDSDSWQFADSDSKDWHDMPSPSAPAPVASAVGKMMTRASRQSSQSINQAKVDVAAPTPKQSINQAKLGPSKLVVIKPTPSRSGLISSQVTAEVMPRMPVLVDAREEDFDFSDGDESLNGVTRKDSSAKTSKLGGKAPKVRPGAMSSHAVYARMNRERKKKYLAELEAYKKAMTKRSMESQRQLEDIHQETQELTQEISSLRTELPYFDVELREDDTNAHERKGEKCNFQSLVKAVFKRGDEAKRRAGFTSAGEDPLVERTIFPRPPTRLNGMYIFLYHRRRAMDRRHCFSS